RYHAPAVLRLACAGDRIVLTLGIDQLGGALDDIRRILAFDGIDEGAVDEPEPEVGSAVPHRKGRGFNQVRQRTERPFGLAEAECELRPLLLTDAGVEKP